MSSASSQTSSGGRPPREAPRSIEPRRRVEAQAHLSGRRDLRAEQVAAGSGEHVVMVGRGRAARKRKHAEGRRRQGMLGVGVDAGPQRVERAQPAEQVLLLCEATCAPLIEVVVAVHEAGGGEAAARVDHPVPGLRRRWAALADRHDAAALDDEVPLGMLAGVGVDGRDRAAGEDESPGRRRRSGRSHRVTVPAGRIEVIASPSRLPWSAAASRTASRILT